MSTAGLLPRRWRTGCDDAHDADALVGVLETAPLRPSVAGPAIVARIGTLQVLPFLVAVKSLVRRIGRGRVVIIDDGTLAGPDRTILAYHCGDPEILQRRAVRLGGFPPGQGWEPWLTAFDRRRGEYWLLLDPLAVATGPVPDIERALGANRSLSAGTALAGLGAGGPGRPDPQALFEALGGPPASPLEARALLMAREGGPAVLDEAEGLAFFGPNGAGAHAAASRAAIAEMD